MITRKLKEKNAKTISLQNLRIIRSRRRNPSKKIIGKLLPSYDALTNRVERNIFLALGLVAMIEIGMTVSNGLLFASKLDERSLSTPVNGLAIKTISAEPSAVIVPVVQPTLSAERTRLNRLALPKS